MPLLHYKSDNVDKTILFIHIPKTAGKSLSALFRQIGFKEKFTNEYDYLRPPLKVTFRHLDYQQLDALFDLNSVYSFAVVRNPLDRLISDYGWAMSRSRMKDQQMSFESWVIFMFSEYRKNQYILNNHTKPQHLFVGSKVTRIFKYEEGLDIVLPTILKDCSLKISNRMKMLNENSSSAYPQYDVDKGILTQCIKDRIFDFYKEDFKAFSYSMD